MNAPIQKIVTPVTKTEIEIKEWITGAEAEHIDAALYNGVDMKPDRSGSMQFGKFNGQAITDQTHREIETFVVSVGGKKEGVLEAVTGLPEDDYKFVKAEIAKHRKKKRRLACNFDHHLRAKFRVGLPHIYGAALLVHCRGDRRIKPTKEKWQVTSYNSFSKPRTKSAVY